MSAGLNVGTQKLKVRLFVHEKDWESALLSCPREEWTFLTPFVLHPHSLMFLVILPVHAACISGFPATRVLSLLNILPLHVTLLL